jgi:hypothetical protein
VEVVINHTTAILSQPQAALNILRVLRFNNWHENSMKRRKSFKTKRGRDVRDFQNKQSISKLLFVIGKRPFELKDQHSYSFYGE